MLLLNCEPSNPKDPKRARSEFALNRQTTLPFYPRVRSGMGVAGQSPQTGLVAPPQYRARTPGEGCGDRPRPPSEVRRFVPFLRRFVP